MTGNPSPDANAALRERDLAAIWHPCTQMRDHTGPDALPMTPIVRGDGAWLVDASGKRYLDAVSSWWTNIFGHANPRIGAAVKDQLDRLEHVIFAGFTHVPAIQLAEELLRVAPRPLPAPPGEENKHFARVFLADSGSGAVEVALKMSFHYWQNQGQPRKRVSLTLTNSYHGETLGALAVGNVDSTRATYAPLLMDVLTLPRRTATSASPARAGPSTRSASSR